MGKPFCLVLLIVLVTVSVSINDTEGFRGLGKVFGGAKNFLSGRKTGGSGKPQIHFNQAPNRKSAMERAREAGRGNPPIHHQPHGPGQQPHFHPGNRDGSIRKDGSHFQYPKNKGK